MVAVDFFLFSSPSEFGGLFNNFFQRKALLCFPHLLPHCRALAFFLKPGMFCREQNLSLAVRDGMCHGVFGHAQKTELS